MDKPISKPKTREPNTGAILIAYKKVVLAVQKLTNEERRRVLVAADITCKEN